MAVNILTSVFTNLQMRLKARAMYMLGNPTDAEDALQEAFYRLWRRHADISDPVEAEGYTVATVRNISIDMLRSRSAHQAVQIDSVDLSDYANEDTGASDTFTQVKAIIESTLSERDRQIMYRREMYGHDFEEIARDFGITEDNARAIVSRARKAIRAQYRLINHKQ